MPMLAGAAAEAFRQSEPADIFAGASRAARHQFVCCATFAVCCADAAAAALRRCD